MYQIRQAKVEDISIIQSLANTIWYQCYPTIISETQIAYMLNLMYSHDSLTQQMIENKHHFNILYDQNNPIGFSSLSAKENKIFKLEKLYLNASHNRKGLGKILYNFTEDLATEQNAAAIILTVNKSNPAIAFYKNIGFEIYDEVVAYIGNGYVMDDYVMKKMLGV